jgi:hypothetical protein
MERLLAIARFDFDAQHHRIGPAPDEVILLYTIASGRLEGPGVDLSVIPGCSGECGIMRGDGMIALESRQLLRSPGDDLVYATFSGFYDLGNDGYVDALDDLLAASACAQITVRFYTAAKNYRWLNRLQFIGIGQRDFTTRTLALRIFHVQV